MDMATTPSYTRWFALAGEGSAPALHDAAPFYAGDIIASGSGNRNQEPPTQAVSDDIVIPLSMFPMAKMKKGIPCLFRPV